MRVAIDSGPLTSGDSVRGIGVYTRELLKALNMSGVDLSKEDLSKYDVVHFTRFNPFFVSIPFSKPKNTKFVLTIYDLIPLIYPDHYPSGVRGWIKWQINKYLIHKNIDAIITISETSKKDICRLLGVSPNKVFVTYLAPREIFRKLKIKNYKLQIVKQFGLPERFALYVGDINYNKNIPWLVEKAKEKKLPLVIVGKQAKEWKDGKLDLTHPELSHLARVKTDNLICLGFVEDIDLVKIYNLATVFIQPSLYEGFGLPLLEAVACGIPVEYNKKCQVLVEIMEKRTYSWEKTAKETMEVYNS